MAEGKPPYGDIHPMRVSIVIITYLVISWPYTEICQVGASPSIDCTNPTYFRVRSGNDQTSVLLVEDPFLYS